jgi:hypothetical protein
MKQFVKLFESFLNEENETIKAQGACKNAMFILQKDINNLLKRMTDMGILSNYNTKVEIYNTGYQLKINTTLVHKYVKDMTPAEDFASSFAWANSYIWLQPGSFFESYLEEGKGAYMEGKGLQLGKDTKDTYPKYDIKSKSDIDKYAKEFVKTVQSQIAEAYSKLELNESANPQSMTRFQIGDRVVCIDDTLPCCHMRGKIIAFEDATIRWEADATQTGIGQTSQQYRCLPQCLVSEEEFNQNAITPAPAAITVKEPK